MINTTHVLLNTVIHRTGLLVGQGRIESLGNRSSGNAITMLAVLLILAAVGGAIWFAWRRLAATRDEACDCPQRLFQELCRAHSLTWSDRSVLRRLAQRGGLESTAEIFFRPDLLEAGGGDSPISRQIQGLRVRLFEA